MDITNNAILSNPGEQAVPNINQYKNLMALVDIGQVINSTLELNEVLPDITSTWPGFIKLKSLPFKGCLAIHPGCSNCFR
jgi:hypothetical protein